jgi:hypothetical protein
LLVRLLISTSPVGDPIRKNFRIDALRIVQTAIRRNKKMTERHTWGIAPKDFLIACFECRECKGGGLQ